MSKRKKLFVALASVAVLVLGGIAYAAWTADGSGTGTAHARTAIVVDVNAATGAADLYPGGPAGDIHFTLDNDNPYAVTFTGFTAGTITSSDETNCPASLVSVDNTDPISVPVAGATSGFAGEIDGVVSLDHAAGDGCQGVTFDIDLTLAGSQD